MSMNLPYKTRGWWIFFPSQSDSHEEGQNEWKCNHKFYRGESTSLRIIIEGNNNQFQTPFLQNAGKPCM